MTPQAILDSLKRAGPVCTLCSGREHLILGDGPPVCSVCVLSLGTLAGDPMHADPDRLVELEAAHGDVVSLQPCQKHVGGCWAWVGWT